VVLPHALGLDARKRGGELRQYVVPGRVHDAPTVPATLAAMRARVSERARIVVSSSTASSRV